MLNTRLECHLRQVLTLGVCGGGGGVEGVVAHSCTRRMEAPRPGLRSVICGELIKLT